MTARTPAWKAEGELKTRASRYVKMDVLPWRPTAFPGIEIKVLLGMFLRPNRFL